MLITKSLFKALLLAALVTPLAALNARADIVTFDPLISVVNIGDIFNVDIVGRDFIELAGGTIDLGYDNTVVEINSDPNGISFHRFLKASLVCYIRTGRPMLLAEYESGLKPIAIAA